MSWIRVSDELEQILSAEWSEPVQVRIAKEPAVANGELELIFRTHTCPRVEVAGDGSGIPLPPIANTAGTGA